jgi:hypothetical protein
VICRLNLSGEEGKADGGDSSLSWLAAECDGTASFFDCGFRDSEAKAGSAGGAGTGGIGAVEAFEDVRKIVGVDAFAVVLDRYFDDGDFDGIGLEGDTEFDLGLWWTVLDGVEE